MIRNAVLHLTNEQPLLVDLFEAPRAADVSLVCTNLRQLNGQRPIFVERSDSMFVFPYAQIRFVEVPAGAPRPGREAGREADVGEADAPGGRDVAGGEDVASEADLELDPALLERIRRL
jgi:hypothetical protein